MSSGQWPGSAVNSFSNLSSVTLSTLRLEIPQRQFQPAEVRMVIVADGEGDIDFVPSQERGLLQAFRHMPAEGAKGSSQLSVPSFQLTARCFGFLCGGDGCAIGMAARNRQDRCFRELWLLCLREH